MISNMNEILNPYPSPTLSSTSFSSLDGQCSYNFFPSPPSPPLPSRKRLKPPHPYPYLIATCFLRHTAPTMRLPQIYAALESRFPFYFSKETQNWKNTVRFNLSRSKIFIKSHTAKVSKKGPGRLQSEWCIHPTWKARILEDGVDVLKSIGDARKSRAIQLSSVHVDKRLRISSILN